MTPRRRSPLQNRVTPTGEIVAHPARGRLMGNRGILHDENRELGVSRWKHRAWIACVLSFKGYRRELMSPGQYTELFFADEAVALAAGHRPCAECRRADFNRFRTAFARAFPEFGPKPSAPRIDKVLHEARVVPRRRMQKTYRAELPDGAFFRLPMEGGPVLRRDGRCWSWSFDGYRAINPPPGGEVEVLTPRPIVETLRAGYELVGNGEATCHLPTGAV